MNRILIQKEFEDKPLLTISPLRIYRTVNYLSYLSIVSFNWHSL